jgi:hypothetical protein
VQHLSYNTRFGTVCQNCHVYPVWPTTKFTHTFSVFPVNHKGFTRCSDCHPAKAYGNKGGCIECHTVRGETVHNSPRTNATCLSCHPRGQK